MTKISSYYSLNKDRILAKANTKVTCECGAVVSYSSMGWHRRSSQHSIWVQMEKQKALRKEQTETVPPMGLEH